LLAIFAFAPTTLLAQQDKAGQSQTQQDQKDPGALGMSILGNQEAPKALVIVPWKHSELGNIPGTSTLLDDSRLPIDKEVFLRMLSYYEIRSETINSNAAPLVTATQGSSIGGPDANHPGVGGPGRSKEAATAVYRTDLDGGPDANHPGVGGPGRSKEAATAVYRTDLDGGPDANKRRKQ
jgi:hypothetical protein